MTKTKTTLTFAVAALALLGFAGCGDDNGASTAVAAAAAAAPAVEADPITEYNDRIPTRRTATEFVADTDLADLAGLCNSMTDLMNAGMSTDEVIDFMIDTINDSADMDPGLTAPEVLTALVTWCTDHEGEW